MADFEGGELVTLKSGGPVMTISGFGNGTVYCSWFDSTNEYKTLQVSPYALQLATDDDLRINKKVKLEGLNERKRGDREGHN